MSLGDLWLEHQVRDWGGSWGQGQWLGNSDGVVLELRSESELEVRIRVRLEIGLVRVNNRSFCNK